MVDGGEPGVDSRDEGKHTGRNDLLFVEKMMWMGERVWSGFACCAQRDDSNGRSSRVRISWGPICEISYTIYHKIIVRLTCDSDERRAKFSLKNIVS